MPDDNDSNPIQSDSLAKGPEAPMPEQQQRAESAAQIGQNNVQAEITGLKRRIGKAEGYMIWLTGAIALFGLCSVIVGVFQWCAMRGQLGEMERQNTLVRQQLIGSQAAVVTINGPISIDPYPLTENTNISIGLKNDRETIANDVELHLTIQIINIASNKPTGKGWACDHIIGVLPLTTQAQPAVYKQCFVNRISQEDFDGVEGFTKTMEVAGFYSYDDGFGDIRKQPVCVRYMPPVKTTKYGIEGENRLSDCDVFPIYRDRLLRHLQEQTSSQNPN